MAADTSAFIFIQMFGEKWRTLIIRAEWLRILITCSLYTDLFSVGMKLNRFPSGRGRSCTLARPSSYVKSHFSLCHATRGVHLVESMPAFHYPDFHPCRRLKWKKRSFIISTAQLCMRLVSRAQSCLIGQMVRVLTL